MLAKELMSKPAATCSRETNLGAAVEILWNQNCGFLPVVDAEEEVVAVITDRDICIVLGTRNLPPGEILAGDVASGNVIACKTDDEIHQVLPVMAEARVRRLPDLDFQGKLAGSASSRWTISCFTPRPADPAMSPRSNASIVPPSPRPSARRKPPPPRCVDHLPSRAKCNGFVALGRHAAAERAIYPLAETSARHA